MAHWQEMVISFASLAFHPKASLSFSSSAVDVVTRLLRVYGEQAPFDDLFGADTSSVPTAASETDIVTRCEEALGGIQVHWRPLLQLWMSVNVGETRLEATASDSVASKYRNALHNFITVARPHFHPVADTARDIAATLIPDVITVGAKRFVALALLELFLPLTSGASDIGTDVLSELLTSWSRLPPNHSSDGLWVDIFHRLFNAERSRVLHHFFRSSSEAETAAGLEAARRCVATRNALGPALLRVMLARLQASVELRVMGSVDSNVPTNVTVPTMGLTGNRRAGIFAHWAGLLAEFMVMPLSDETEAGKATSSLLASSAMLGPDAWTDVPATGAASASVTARAAPVDAASDDSILDALAASGPTAGIRGFARFVRGAHLYLHPSQLGQWSVPLVSFARHLMDELGRRLAYQAVMIPREAPAIDALPSAIQQMIWTRSTISAVTTLALVTTRPLVYARDPSVVMEAIACIRASGTIAPRTTAEVVAALARDGLADADAHTSVSTFKAPAVLSLLAGSIRPLLTPRPFFAEHLPLVLRSLPSMIIPSKPMQALAAMAVLEVAATCGIPRGPARTLVGADLYPWAHPAFGLETDPTTGALLDAPEGRTEDTDWVHGAIDELMNLIRAAEKPASSGSLGLRQRPTASWATLQSGVGLAGLASITIDALLHNLPTEEAVDAARKVATSIVSGPPIDDAHAACQLLTSAAIVGPESILPEALRRLIHDAAPVVGLTLSDDDMPASSLESRSIGIPPLSTSGSGSGAAEGASAADPRSAGGRLLAWRLRLIAALVTEQGDRVLPFLGGILRVALHAAVRDGEASIHAAAHEALFASVRAISAIDPVHETATALEARAGPSRSVHWRVPGDEARHVIATVARVTVLDTLASVTAALHAAIGKEVSTATAAQLPRWIGRRVEAVEHIVSGLGGILADHVGKGGDDAALCVASYGLSVGECTGSDAAARRALSELLAAMHRWGVSVGELSVGSEETAVASASLRHLLIAVTTTLLRAACADDNGPVRQLALMQPLVSLAHLLMVMRGFRDSAARSSLADANAHRRSLLDSIVIRMSECSACHRTPCRRPTKLQPGVFVPASLPVDRSLTVALFRRRQAQSIFTHSAALRAETAAKSGDVGVAGDEPSAGGEGGDEGYDVIDDDEDEADVSANLTEDVPSSSTTSVAPHRWRRKHSTRDPRTWVPFEEDPSCGPLELPYRRLLAEVLVAGNSPAQDVSSTVTAYSTSALWSILPWLRAPIGVGALFALVHEAGVARPSMMDDAAASGVSESLASSRDEWLQGQLRLLRSAVRLLVRGGAHGRALRSWRVRHRVIRWMVSGALARAMADVPAGFESEGQSLVLSLLSSTYGVREVAGDVRASATAEEVEARAQSLSRVLRSLRDAAIGSASSASSSASSWTTRASAIALLLLQLPASIREAAPNLRGSRLTSDSSRPGVPGATDAITADHMALLLDTTMAATTDSSSIAQVRTLAIRALTMLVELSSSSCSLGPRAEHPWSGAAVDASRALLVKDSRRLSLLMDSLLQNHKEFTTAADGQPGGGAGRVPSSPGIAAAIAAVPDTYNYSVLASGFGGHLHDHGFSARHALVIERLLHLSANAEGSLDGPVEVLMAHLRRVLEVARSTDGSVGAEERRCAGLLAAELWAATCRALLVQGACSSAPAVGTAVAASIHALLEILDSTVDWYPLDWASDWATALEYATHGLAVDRISPLIEWAIAGFEEEAAVAARHVEDARSKVAEAKATGSRGIRRLMASMGVLVVSLMRTAGTVLDSRGVHAPQPGADIDVAGYHPFMAAVESSPSDCARAKAAAVALHEAAARRLLPAACVIADHPASDCRRSGGVLIGMIAMFGSHAGAADAAVETIEKLSSGASADPAALETGDPLVVIHNGRISTALHAATCVAFARDPRSAATALRMLAALRDVKAAGSDPSVGVDQVNSLCGALSVIRCCLVSRSDAEFVRDSAAAVAAGLALRVGGSDDESANPPTKATTTAAAPTKESPAAAHLRGLLETAAAGGSADAASASIARVMAAMLDASTWRMRVALLTSTAAVLCRHSLVWPSSAMDALQREIRRRMTDPRAEVRAAAQQAWIGCTPLMPVPARLAVADQWLKMALRPIADGPTAQVDAAVRLRHGLALGVGAVVQSFPFSVPEALPPILAAMSRLATFPAIIRDAAKDAWAEFRRTHADTWEDDRAAFEPEQLEALSALGGVSRMFA